MTIATTAALKRWKIDAGNSNTGPCGFVVYDLWAATPEDALTKLRDTFALPEHIEGKGEGDTTIVAYFNADALTLENIEEDPEEDDDDERVCKFCGMALFQDAHGTWVDETEGDCCGGNDTGENENEPHQPEAKDDAAEDRA
jgi:hypothetical protein